MSGTGQGSVGKTDGMPVEGTRCHSLVKDYERYASTLAYIHVIAVACFMIRNAAILAQGA